jgi:hypothetical protein
MVRAMSRTLPIPQEKAFESAQELLSLGLQGQNRLHNTVQALADMQGVMGDAAGSKLKSIIGGAQATTMGGRMRGYFAVTPQDLKEIGLSYDQLSVQLSKQLGRTITTQDLMWGRARITADQGIDALNSIVANGKIGDAAKDALLDPTLLAQQFHDHVRDLFKDVDAKPFLREVRNIVNMFDQGNQTGKNMKKTVTETFNALAKYGKEALIQLQLAVLDLEYYALVAGTAFAPMLKEIKKLKDNRLVMNIIGEAFKEMAIGALEAALAIGFIVYEFAVMMNALDRIGAKKEDMKRMGLDLVVGLATGVATGAITFKNAMKDVADGGMKSIKEVFDAHSPSRKLFRFGRDDLAGALSSGVEEGGLKFGTGTLTITPKALPKAGSGRSIQLTIAPGAVVIQGGAATMPGMQEMVETAFADLIERINEELGSGDD